MVRQSQSHPPPKEDFKISKGLLYRNILQCTKGNKQEHRCISAYALKHNNKSINKMLQIQNKIIKQL